MGQRGVGEGGWGRYFVDSLLQTQASAAVGAVGAVEAVVIWDQPTVNAQTEEEAEEAEEAVEVVVEVVAVVQEHPQ